MEGHLYTLPVTFHLQIQIRSNDSDVSSIFLVTYSRIIPYMSDKVKLHYYDISNPNEKIDFFLSIIFSKGHPSSTKIKLI